MLRYSPPGLPMTSSSIAEGLPPTRLKVAKVAISHAEIIALNTTPKTLIAAPGANQVIVVTNLVFQMTRTAAAYTGGGALEFRYKNATGDKVVSDIAATVVTGGAGSTDSVRGGGDLSDIAVANIENQPIILTNAIANFGGGNTGSAKVIVRYYVADLS